MWFPERWECGLGTAQTGRSPFLGSHIEPFSLTVPVKWGSDDPCLMVTPRCPSVLKGHEHALSVASPPFLHWGLSHSELL